MFEVSIPVHSRYFSMFICWFQKVTQNDQFNSIIGPTFTAAWPKLYGESSTTITTRDKKASLR